MVTQGLPPGLALAYKRYKIDTETVAGWLAGKSALAGYKPSSSNASLTKEPKLKGRARKIARDAAKQSPGPKQSTYKYIVTTAEFVEMAKHIVKYRPKIILSQAMQAVWERTIRMRRQFSQWFQDKTDADVVIDEQHSHFASILEQALATLKPCYEPVKVKPHTEHKGKEKAKETPLEHLNNVFEHLEVEDIISDDEQDHAGVLADSQIGSKTEPPRAKIEFSEKEAESEFFFAIWSFMHDAYAVRVYVAATWQLYCDRKIELMQAAQVTNHAVDLIRRAEADFEAGLHRPQSYPAAKYPTGSLPFLIFKIHIPSQTTVPVSWDLDTPFTAIICGCEICDFLLYVPWTTANWYVHVLEEEPPTFPSKKNDFYCQVPPFPDGKVAGAQFYHARNPSQAAMTALKEILPNFSLLSLMIRGIFLEDEILHAARHILETKVVSIWVSFALQLQLDLERLGQVKPVPAFRDLKQAFEVIRKRADKHFKWTESLEGEIWTKTWQEHVRTLVSQFNEWIDGKNCGKSNPIELRQHMDAGLSPQAAMRASGRVPLLDSFPVTCGTMKSELLLEWHTLGLNLVNYTQHVPVLCHLYTALRILCPDAPSWADMELVIRNQGLGKFFIGGRPQTLEDAEKRFMLSCGMSTSSLARDSRGMRFRKGGDGIRKFEQSPLSQVLFARWLGSETRKVDEASYQLEQLLAGNKYQKQLEHDLYVTDNALTSKLLPAQSKMVRTLIRLSQGFNAEMPALMFDYFSMQRRCFEVYANLKIDFKALVKDKVIFDEDREASLNNPISMAAAIFRKAVETEAVIRAITSNNRAATKALGPGMAKTLKTLLPKPEDEDSQAHMEKVLRLTRQGRFDEVLREFADLSKNASAMNMFKPVRSSIDSMLDQGKGDLEIRKLRNFIGKTSFGIFLFRSPSLEALYGLDGTQKWKDIGIPDTTIEKMALCQADNPFTYLFTLLFLHQKKVMCGKGKDSHASSGFGATDFSDIEDKIRREWFKGKDFASEASVDKEEWDKFEGIYGRAGCLGPDR
ncbi:hypothetical protein H2200_012060 [Cladophialophora chaetospira]|uniref:DUF6604 domain-containing protein n=1 Tax=Cladophialophora chaetospira TaxID=386627 RepID=A0AA38WY69_9EURO|nr:hypothetical protein H2200_012060 [Cladophialophora chaetospira]